MACEQGLLELVVYVIGRGILIRVELVDHDPFLHLDLIVRESRTGGQFEQEGHRLAEIFLQYRRMKHYLFLRRESVEVPAKAVKVAVDHVGALALRALEYRMFGEMRYPAVIAAFVTGPAFDCQGTVSDGIPAPFDSVLQPAGCLSNKHYFLS